jgi:hypothetical protein
MDNQPEARAFALSALLAGVVSMLFAFLGGLRKRGFKPLETSRVVKDKTPPSVRLLKCKMKI